MKNIRIIPRLDIKGANLVKGIHLEGLRVLGNPSDFAQFYYENGADELLFMDVVASLYDRNSLSDIISATAQNKFIPLTVGGGLRTLNDIKEALRAGADKVCLNTAAIRNPEIIKMAVKEYGSSTIVISIEAIKQEDGDYQCFVDNGREYTGVRVIDWVNEVQQLGAGEIVLTSVDREGTGKGFEEDLISSVVDNVSVPLIIHGGVGKKEHIKDVMNKFDVDAISSSSIFHYDFIKRHKNFTQNPKEGNYEFLLSNRNAKNIDSISIKELKSYLDENDFQIRK